jgi:hypothetical protein
LNALTCSRKVCASAVFTLLSWNQAVLYVGFDPLSLPSHVESVGEPLCPFC